VIVILPRPFDVTEELPVNGTFEDLPELASSESSEPLVAPELTENSPAKAYRLVCDESTPRKPKA
jgi:hypothetical protein